MCGWHCRLSSCYKNIPNRYAERFAEHIDFKRDVSASGMRLASSGSNAETSQRMSFIVMKISFSTEHEQRVFLFLAVTRKRMQVLTHVAHD